MKTFLRAVLTGALGFILLIILMVGVYQILYAGKIFPGVSVAGVDVGSLRPAEAAKVLGERITYPQTGSLSLAYADHSWQVTPAQVGLFLDLDKSSQNAYAVGRNGHLLTSLAEQFGAAYYGHPASLAIIFDQRMAFDYLTGLAKQIDVPASDAGVFIQGTQVIVNSAVTGVHLDREASLQTLAGKLNAMSDGEVPLTVQDVKPLVMDVGRQADLARTLLAEPFKLTLPSGQPDGQQSFTIQPAELAVMLAFGVNNSNGNSDYALALDPLKLTLYFTQLAGQLKLSPVNTRFTFDDSTRQLEVIQPAVIGRELDMAKSIQAVQEKVALGEHSAELAFDFTKPAVTDDMTGEELGITGLMEAQTSYFRGSSSARIQNIKTAAAQFHGLLIAPGETFSMASQLGNISLDNGYAEALIIVGDKTIKGVGGGVCQVSSTLFRTAFFAGLPIAERHPHAYRVGYYEQTAGGHSASLAGLDATVYVPLVDFKFTNDTPNWILMETYTSPSYGTLTWKFYSKGDGRSVQWSTTGPQNIVQPPDDLYRENPDLPQGEINHVEYRAEGADVTVNREVYRNGDLYFKDSFFTHYQPWQAVFEYGPGTELPTPTPSP
jgi:vancomycin resistance protein YoaR